MTADSHQVSLTSEEFRNVMGHFASGVTVITAEDQGTPVGTTASAFSSLSLDPPMLLVCLNKSSYTAQVIHQTRKFGVNILGEDHPDLALRFARKGADKFAGLDWHAGPNGIPLLDDALAKVECHLSEETEGGTHYVFLAIADFATLTAGAPLAYYRGRFGRLETDADIHAARLVQGYILDQDAPPGTPLEVDELARLFDIPRGTIYHALGTLREQGLVFRDEAGRFRVATLSLKMVVEALEARGTIELGVVARSMERVTAEQVADLRRAAEATKRHHEGRQPSEAEWARANREFHEKLVAMTGNGSLANVYRQFNITAIMGRVQHDVGGIDPRDLVAEREHLALVEAFENRDYDAAVEAIVSHTENSITAARLMMEKKVG